MGIVIEHINLTVANVDRALSFLTAAFPDWKLRHRDAGERGDWLHYGDDTFYIGLDTAVDITRSGRRPYHDLGFNHVGLIVDDLDGIRQRLKAAGFEETMTAFDHPHRRRAYWLDQDRNEWEFTEYSSNKESERNDYTL